MHLLNCMHILDSCEFFARVIQCIDAFKKEKAKKRKKEMNTFWLVSAPGNPTKQDTINQVKEGLSKVSEVYSFNLPEFKVIILFQN